jgi:hypothetical protein
MRAYELVQHSGWTYSLRTSLSIRACLRVLTRCVSTQFTCFTHFTCFASTKVQTLTLLQPCSQVPCSQSVSIRTFVLAKQVNWVKQVNWERLLSSSLLSSSGQCQLTKPRSMLTKTRSMLTIPLPLVPYCHLRRGGQGERCYHTAPQRGGAWL